MAPRYLFTVHYRRQAWSSRQSKVYHREQQARRLVRDLLGDSWDWSHLSPIVEIALTRRPIGEEETIEEWTPKKPWRRRQ